MSRNPHVVAYHLRHRSSPLTYEVSDSEMYLPGRFRRRQGPAGLAPGLDGERCGVHGAAAGSARARTHARRPRAVGDRRRQGAAQSARRCPRRRRSHSTLPTAQGAQPRRPRAESPPDVRPGGPAAGLSSGQRGRGAPATDGARDAAGAKRPDRCRRQCARRPRGNAHGTEAGAAADAPPLLRDDELYRESDRHAPARHAEHQTLARWRHAPAVDRARPAARRGAFPVHQAPWRARRARDGPRHRHVRGAPPRESSWSSSTKTRGHNWLRIDLLPGGRYVGYPPCCSERKVRWAAAALSQVQQRAGQPLAFSTPFELTISGGLTKVSEVLARARSPPPASIPSEQTRDSSTRAKITRTAFLISTAHRHMSSAARRARSTLADRLGRCATWRVRRPTPRLHPCLPPPV